MKRGPTKLHGVMKHGMHLCRSRFYTKRSERQAMLYSILEEFLYRLRTNDILEHAYGLAFNFTLAIFPATIFVFTLIPYIPIPGLELKILFLLKEIIPESVYEALIPTIQDTVSKQRSGLLSFGFITTLYLATNGMMSLVKTFNRSDKEAMPNQRGYFKQRAIATLLTLALALVLFCTIMLLIVARQILDYMISYGLIASRFKINLILGSRLVIVFFMFFMAISGIYYLAPATKKYW
ncbi:MAG: YhjD/YihY/BrkB family envelope integrity protein, partial [Bacteroidota bacterium]